MFLQMHLLYSPVAFQDLDRSVQIRGPILLSPALCLPAMLDPARIAELLRPFLGETPVSAALAPQLQTYLELLLRWNTRINLTAVRDPEQIVTRHFGESLFAAGLLLNVGAFSPTEGGPPSLADVGSGAGFPGIPIKLFAPSLHLTLIESQNKKATFLREVVRTLGLSHTVVHCGRAETWGGLADVVTLRAVEKFEAVLPVASALVATGGTLCLLIGEAQTRAAAAALGSDWAVVDCQTTPASGGRTVWLAQREGSQSPR